MKQFPAHIAAQSMAEQATGTIEPGTPGETDEKKHPLAAELEQMLSQRTASVGTLAAIVEQLMGELNIAKDKLAPDWPAGAEKAKG